MRRAAEFDEALLPAAIEALSSPSQADVAAMRWPAATLPVTELLAALGRPGAVGVVTTTIDADGQLRRLPLLHEASGRLLPSLALSAQLIEAHAVLPLPRAATRCW